MSVEGIAAVQARVAELRTLVMPGSTAVGRTVTSSTDATSGASSTATSTATTSASGIGGLTGDQDLTGATTSSQFAAALAAADGASAAGTTASAGRASGTGIAPGTDVTAQDLISTAKKYLGVPYVWGGESLSEGGLDCSGLVLRSLTDLGIAKGVPRTAHEQQKLGTKVDSLADARPGDLLIFNGGTHIAIYLGDHQMIDAPKPGGVVNIRDVYKEPSNIRRILPQEGSTAALQAGSGATTAASASLAALSGLSGTTAAAATSTAATSTDASRAAWDVLVGAAS